MLVMPSSKSISGSIGGCGDSRCISIGSTKRGTDPVFVVDLSTFFDIMIVASPFQVHPTLNILQINHFRQDYGVPIYNTMTLM